MLAAAQLSQTRAAASSRAPTRRRGVRVAASFGGSGGGKDYESEGGKRSGSLLDKISENENFSLISQAFRSGGAGGGGIFSQAR